MPKRDEKYMQGQRDMIARAALECMFEKGFEATTLRDVASQAGISMGTLYAHFKTRDDLVQAVGSLDPVSELVPVDRWEDYEAKLRTTINALEENERFRKITAVSYELLADLVRTQRSIQAIEARWDQAYDFFRVSLLSMKEQGEISLPLGLDLTVQVHIELQLGATSSILGDRRLDFGNVRDGFLTALAFTAGRSAVASKGVAGDGPNETKKGADVASPDIDDRITLDVPQMGAPSTCKLRQPGSLPVRSSS